MKDVVPVFFNFCDLIGVQDIRIIGKGVVGLIQECMPRIEKSKICEKESRPPIPSTGDVDKAAVKGKMSQFRRQYETTF